MPDKLSKDSQDLIKLFLMRNPQERLGANNGFQEIKKHPWFKNVNWDDVIQKKTQPQIYPVKKLKER